MLNSIRINIITSTTLYKFLANTFLAKFVFYEFFKNFSYSNLKKLLKVFKLYISKYSKIYILQKFFLQLLK